MNHEVKIKIVASVYKTFSFPRALSPTIRRRYVYAHARIAVASSNYIHSCRGSTHVASVHPRVVYHRMYACTCVVVV